MIFLYLVSILLVAVNGDVINCATQETCESCLAIDFSCGWCTDENYPTKNPRCLPEIGFNDMGCGTGKIETNKKRVTLLDDKELQDYQQNEQTIQIRPQRAKLHLVKGHTTEIRMTYRPARNHPLDVYYLMDLTFSMKDDRKNLVSMGRKLAQTLGSLTDNYRLGFGSYAYAYDFRHHLSLTNDIKAFMQKISESRVTGNLDKLDGTSDALMQVIVCTDKIDWREDSGKIVVVATDSIMNFAGDGLLAGLVEPNDKKCHLSETGQYEAALKFDFPSLEEIYRELLERKINVIFAVTQKVAYVYRQVVELLPDIGSIIILSDDSSNIVDLVAESYKKFVRKVNFVDTSPPNIDVSYKTNCGISGGKMKHRNTCDNLDIGQEVEFIIELTPKDFPENHVYDFIIRIEETGLSEYLQLEVEIQKPCPCQRSNESRPMRRDLCSRNGNFECGECYCDEGWTGKICNCNSKTVNSNDLRKQCRKPTNSSTPGPVCSNNGECECGQCFCLPGFEGKYCECETCSQSCNLEQADCVCGICQCKPDWTGPLCACSLSTDTCLSPDDEVCSGQGDCVCGKCECNPLFHGKFCEINQQDEASGKTNKICQYFKPCVEQLLRKRKNEKVDISEVCIDSSKMMFGYSFVEKVEEQEEICVARVKFEDDMSCDYKFIYDMKQNAKQLFIEWYDCQPPNLVAWVSFSVLATILLGLMVICIVMVYM